MVTRVPIVLGGTGADNAADARANLGVLSATGNVVVSNIVIGSGNVLHSVSGANVTFDPPGTTVAGAQFMTPGIHDLATQRIVTLKSNNYSGNRGTGGGDYVVPTMNIKAKYNNVAINTAGRVIFSNRYDSETDMPDTAKYEGLVTFDRNPGGPGVLLYANARNRHKILTANADITPGTNLTYSIGTAAAQWTDVRIANDFISTSGNVIAKGANIAGGGLFVNEQTARIGVRTSNPQHDFDIRSNVYITGNLTVRGNVISVDTSHLHVDDPVIELGANTKGAPTLDTGVLMNRGSSANAFIGYDESSDQFITALTSDPSSVTTITVGSYAPIQTGPLHTNYLANIAGNASVSRSLAVGYTDHRVPQANLDVKGNVIINGTTTDDFLVLKTTDAGALSAPDVIFYRMSASPADDDHLGKLTFRGRNDNTQDVEYAQIISQIVDASDGTEDGRLYLQTKVNGSDLNHVTLDSTGATFNGTVITKGANVTGNVSVTRGLAVGYTDGRVPQANLDVKGNVYIDGNTHVRDQQILSFGTGKDLQIFHDGSHSYIKDAGTGNLIIAGESTWITNVATDETIAKFVTNGAVELYYDNAKKFETASNGAISTGNLTPSANVVFSLGQPEKAWKELWLQGNSLHLGNTSISIGKTGEVEFMKTNKLGQPVTSVDVANVHASIDAGGVLSFYSANTTGNVSLGRGLAVGYVGEKVPGANLDVNGNAYISGATTIGGAATFDDNLYVADNIRHKGDTDTYIEFTTDKIRTIAGGKALITATEASTDTVIINDGGNDLDFRVEGIDDENLLFTDGLNNRVGIGTSSPSALFHVDGNTVIARSIAIGYTDGRVPQANLDVKGNTFISGKITGTMTPTFMGANVTGNVSVTRSLAVGWTDGRVPQANLEVIGNANVGILTATSLRINGSPVSTTSTFTGLTDTPSSYSGQAGKLTAVNSSANALEFVDDNAIVMAIALG